jgi:hypothetical protein
MNLERDRTGGMTVIAVLNIVVGSIESFAGSVQLLDVHELWRLGDTIIVVARVGLGIPALAAGVVGIIAGIAMLTLRPWARVLSLAFSGCLTLMSVLLLILTSAFTPLIIPVLASIGSYDLSATNAGLTLFAVSYLALPLSYALVLSVVFRKSAWRAMFAQG